MKRERGSTGTRTKRGSEDEEEPTYIYNGGSGLPIIRSSKGRMNNKDSMGTDTWGDDEETKYMQQEY